MTGNGIWKSRYFELQSCRYWELQVNDMGGDSVPGIVSRSTTVRY